MSTLRARVRLFDANTGGRREGTGSGYRPHLRVDGGDLLGVEFRNLEQPIKPGEQATVDLELLYVIDYSELREGAVFAILEGPRKVGEGEIL